MADDWKENESVNDNQPNMSLSLVVSIPVCHTGERGTIPRKRELLDLNTSFHQITVSTLAVSKIKPEKTWRMIVKKTKNGNDNQLNISVRKVVNTPVCHVMDRG